jgi:hypothetical protein
VAETRIRLLADVPEGAPGNEVVVSKDRARDLIAIEQAERVLVRTVPVETTVVVADRAGVSAAIDTAAEVAPQLTEKLSRRRPTRP